MIEYILYIVGALIIFYIGYYFGKAVAIIEVRDNIMSQFISNANLYNTNLGTTGTKGEKNV
jgi:hypothetical protein